MKKYLFIIFILPVPLLAQNFSENLAFYHHLINTRNYSDALLLLENSSASSKGQQDSLNFYFGKTYYLNQQLYDASEYFDKALASDALFKTEARFYNAFSKLHIDEIDKAVENLNDIETSDSVIIALKNLELSGAYLLQRNFERFDVTAKNFQQKYYQVSSQEATFLDIRQDLEDHKAKSPFLAGLMSAIVPGSGRIYAGKTGLGIGTLLTNAILGLQTWEAYRKDGVESARFIIFGSLFSVFYVGNIWGSVFTVKIANEEFQDAVNHKILVDLHIPLRTIYK